MHYIYIVYHQYLKLLIKSKELKKVIDRPRLSIQRGGSWDKWNWPWVRGHDWHTDWHTDRATRKWNRDWPGQFYDHPQNPGNKGWVYVDALFITL